MSTNPGLGTRPPAEVTISKRKASNHDIAEHISFFPHSDSSSNLSPASKEETWQMKAQGACLRCRTMRRTCSRGDPCRTCLSTAEKSAQSKALKWMDCIRTNLREVNIYRDDPTNPPKKQLEKLFQTADTPIYNLDVDASIIANWLSEGGSNGLPFQKSLVWKYYFVIFDIALQRQRDSLPMEKIFNHFLGRSLGVDFPSIKQVDPAILKGMACYILDMLDDFIKPCHLEAFRRDRQRLVELFVLTWILYVAAVQDLELQRRQRMIINASQAMGEALVRLLWHYLIYLGNVASLIETGDDGRLWQTKDAGCRKYILKHVLDLHLHDAGGTIIITKNEDDMTGTVRPRGARALQLQHSQTSTRAEVVGNNTNLHEMSITDWSILSKTTSNLFGTDPGHHGGMAKAYFLRLAESHRRRGWSEQNLMSLIEDFLEIPRAPSDRLSLLMSYRLRIKYRFEEEKMNDHAVASSNSPRVHKRIRTLAPAPVSVEQRRFHAVETGVSITGASENSLQRLAQRQGRHLEYGRGTSTDFPSVTPNIPIPTYPDNSPRSFAHIAPSSVYSYSRPYDVQNTASNMMSSQPTMTSGVNRVSQNPQPYGSSFQTWNKCLTPTAMDHTPYAPSADPGIYEGYFVPVYQRPSFE
ncbi:hypothetical protein BDV96DRAFT_644211 [Lophiotrema nucula]|uniref:Uncharacterized protein n=1 Tax=Lophiotrema nucula TaxID=690887 RepID=A0A6A5ZF92_9PLEO|nr:hypothetical protein BDV96DRAFT_644211 [Lophiotrema nucula]